MGNEAQRLLRHYSIVANALITSQHSLSSSAKWEAKYSFGKEKRKIHNKISARFEFANGKIAKHVDSFSLNKWMGMAMGTKGTLFGWLPSSKKKLRDKSLKGLDMYIRRRKLGPKN